MKRIVAVIMLAGLVGCSGGSVAGPDAPVDVASAAGPSDTVMDDGDCWVSSDGRRCGPDDPVGGGNVSAPFAGQ